MNKTFDIKRFGNVLRYDAMSYLKNFGWTLIVLWAIPIGIWFLLYMNMEGSGAMVEAERYSLSMSLMVVAILLAPSRLYKNANDSRKGIQFALLPASNFEKFLSMVLFCFILTPMLYIVGTIAIDTILALMPGKNPYEGFVLSKVFHQDLLKIHLNDSRLIVMKLPFYQIFVLLSLTSIFMFTNMVFKKRKVSKTIGILVLLWVIFIVISIRVLIHCEDIYGEYDTIPDDIQEIIGRWLYYGYYVFNIILTSVMLYLTYRKIRKQTY